MLPVVVPTLLAFLSAIVLAVSQSAAPLVVAHLVFAVGVVPLIFAAMLHFVPVLTRTGGPGRWLEHLPLVAQLLGLGLMLVFLELLPYRVLAWLAGLEMLLAGWLLRWIWQRARGSLGPAHPGWRWYALALVMFMLAMLAIIGQVLWPAWHAVWRLFHLHVNTLGMVGLAALGTLPVLLPTVLGRADPQATAWLRQKLPVTVLGVLLVALGAAWGPPGAHMAQLGWLPWSLSTTGAALLFVVLIILLARWFGQFGGNALLAEGAATSLVLAVLGLVLLLAVGILHGSGLLPGRPAIAAWGMAWLFPLVNGALSHLLPVWRWPGPDSAARQEMRQQLGAGAALRAVLFFLAGLALALSLEAVAGPLLLAGAVLWAVAGWRAMSLRPRR